MTLRATLIALSAILSTPANATIISYSNDFITHASFSGQSTGTLVEDQTYTVDTVSLNGFDSSLGTLTDVQLSFTSSWYLQSRIGAFENGPYDVISFPGGHTYLYGTYGSISTSLKLSASLLDPVSSTTSITHDLLSYCSRSFATFYYYYGDNASCSDSRTTGIRQLDGILDLSGIDISAFLKPTGDMVDISFTNKATYSLNCDNEYHDQCNSSASGSWAGTVTITYTYDPSQQSAVPEPGMLALLGIGLAGIIVTRRKARPSKLDAA